MQDGEWTYLCGVGQDLEADIIIGLLEAQNIPAFKRYPGAGEFMKIAYGLTSGVDIFVPGQYLDNAKDLLQTEMPNTAIIESDSDDSETVEFFEAESEAEKIPDREGTLSWPLSAIIILIVVLILFIFRQNLPF